jgi:phosphosulfolactate phosphohydrolase-like enzyme
MSKVFFSSSVLRNLAIVATAAIALSSATTAIPARAQMGKAMADKIVVGAANAMVSKINGEDCTQFAATMSKMKSGGSSKASPSPMAAKLKGNPQARSEFVNIVAGPLLNKMIDCNMVPGGM